MATAVGARQRGNGGHKRSEGYVKVVTTIERSDVCEIVNGKLVSKYVRGERTEG